MPYTLTSKTEEIVLVSKDFVGLHSSVGIATRYGLDGPGIESRLGRDFSRPSRSPSFLHNGYRVSFPGGKAAAAWR